MRVFYTETNPGVIIFALVLQICNRPLRHIAPAQSGQISLGINHWGAAEHCKIIRLCASSLAFIVLWDASKSICSLEIKPIDYDSMNIGWKKTIESKNLADGLMMVIGELNH